QSLTIKNTGTSSLTLPSDGLVISGTNASEFALTGARGPATISPGSSKSFPIGFGAKAIGIRTATLTVKTNDPNHTKTTIALRGLGTAGTGGLLEPSLQRILDLYQIPVNVGDDNPNDTNFPVPPKTPNDEVTLQTLKKAGSGNVTIQLLA